MLAVQMQTYKDICWLDILSQVLNASVDSVFLRLFSNQLWFDKVLFFFIFFLIQFLFQVWQKRKW